MNQPNIPVPEMLISSIKSNWKRRATLILTIPLYFTVLLIASVIDAVEETLTEAVEIWKGKP